MMVPMLLREVARIVLRNGKCLDLRNHTIFELLIKAGRSQTPRIGTPSQGSLRRRFGELRAMKELGPYLGGKNLKMGKIIVGMNPDEMVRFERYLIEELVEVALLMMDGKRFQELSAVHKRDLELIDDAVYRAMLRINAHEVDRVTDLAGHARDVAYQASLAWEVAAQARSSLEPGLREEKEDLEAKAEKAELLLRNTKVMFRKEQQTNDNRLASNAARREIRYAGREGQTLKAAENAKLEAAKAQTAAFKAEMLQRYRRLRFL